MIGDKIKYYRELNNLTPIQLANKAGIPVDNIRKYESGARNPKTDALTKIATALGININSFLDIKIDNATDAAPYLLNIGKTCGVRFVGKKDTNGLYDKSVSIQFENGEMQDFIIEWANRLETIKNLRESASNTLDADTKSYMQKRADDMEATLEESLIAKINKSNI